MLRARVESEPSVGRLLQQVDNELVSGQRDGCVGDLSNELWNESSVKGGVALLHRH